MNKFLFILSSILVLAITGCSSHEFNLDDDTTSTADVSSGRDTTSSAASCSNRCGGAYDKALACQCDEACAKNGDCCSDFVQLCSACIDNDKDGYCDTQVKAAGDCNDQNASVHPGATEVCGNSVDDNCNGTTDEGCDGSGTTTATGNTLTVKYPDSASRRLNFGVTSIASDIPYVWTMGSWQTGTTLTADLGNVQTPSSGCLYVRFNVDEPNQKWLCMGTTLNSAPTMTLNVLGKSLSTSSVQKISLGGTCSAIYAVSFNGSTCSIP